MILGCSTSAVSSLHTIAFKDDKRAQLLGIFDAVGLLALGDGPCLGIWSRTSRHILERKEAQGKKETM